MDIKKWLSEKDAVTLLEIIYGLITCKRRSDFTSLALKLNHLIPFDAAFCGLLNANGNEDRNNPGIPISLNYPEVFLERYMSKGYYLIDPVFREVLLTYDVVNWAELEKRDPKTYNTAPITELKDFGICKGVTYGVLDPQLRYGSSLSCAGNNIKNDDRTRIILKCIFPHFTEALRRVINTNVNVVEYKLTNREREIVEWLKDGKSSWDISKILSISENTVNYHIKNIIRKLNAMNRTHAVAIAMRSGLIEL